MAKTPFFVELQRRRKHQFEFQFEGNLEPSLASFLLSKRIPSNLSSTARNQFFNYDLDLFFLVGHGTVRPVFHTPIGAFSVGLGTGPAYLWLNDNRGLTSSGFYWSSSVETTYTVFVTENIFVRFSLSVYNGLFSDIVRTSYFSARKYTSSGFKVGYYLPEGQTYLRSLF